MGHCTVTDFNSELERRIGALREQNLFRELRRVDSPQSSRIKIGGKTFLNFSSNDYLGLANHPLSNLARAPARHGCFAVRWRHFINWKKLWLILSAPKPR